MITVEKKLYSHSKLESELEQELSDLESQWTIDAEVKGARNIPSLSETNVKPYVAHFHHTAQAIATSISAILQPAVLISEVIESEKNMDRRIRELSNKLTPLKEEENKLKKRLENEHRPFGRWRMPVVWVAMCLPLLADGLLNISCFQAYGYNYIEAVGVSILLAGALALLAHFFDRLVAIGKALWQRRLIALGILLTLASFFYFIADIRAEALSIEASSSGAATNYSPFPLTLFSTLLFIVAVCVNRFGYPTRDERKAMREYKEVVQRYQSIAKERKRIEDAIEAIKTLHEELIQMNGSIYVHGGKLEETVINRTWAAYGKWQSTNMMFRPDGARPAAFNGDEYPFIFKQSFREIEFK